MKIFILGLDINNYNILNCYKAIIGNLFTNQTINYKLAAIVTKFWKLPSIHK